MCEKGKWAQSYEQYQLLSASSNEYIYEFSMVRLEHYSLASSHHLQNTYVHFL